MSTVAAFKNKYQAAAAAAAAGTKIFPETVLTAAALESGWGKSELAAKYNNFFGIKYSEALHKGLKFVEFKTKEQTKAGTVYFVSAKFVHYDTATDSFKSYIKFVTGPRYVRAGVTAAKTPAEQFAALKAAGYATDTKYVSKLTSIFKLLGGIVTPAAATGGTAILILVAAFFF